MAHWSKIPGMKRYNVLNAKGMPVIVVSAKSEAEALAHGKKHSPAAVSVAERKSLGAKRPQKA